MNMNILADSLAAGALAVVIAGAVPNPAGASQKALLNPAQVARANGLIVLAEGEKKSKLRRVLPKTVCQKEGELISIPKYSVSIRTSSTFAQLQQR